MKTVVKTILLIFLLYGSIFSQQSFQSFITYLNITSDSVQKKNSIDSFISANQSNGFPYVEGSVANFVYRGNVSSAVLAGDFNSWQTNYQMTKVWGTNFWYFSKQFELNARLDYKIVLNGTNWILDPLNPRTCAGGFGPNSELAMPGYIQPWEITYRAGIPHGTVESRSIYSVSTGSYYSIKIYLPPGYTPTGNTLYPTVYFQDGFEYIDLAGSINMLDNLIDSNLIQPCIGIFVKPNNRNNEYAGALRNKYSQFFATELVRYIDSLYKTNPQPSSRVILGDSYGGNISALISYNYSELFGNCGIHSGAFQPNGYEVFNLITNGPKKNIRYYSVWGTYESLYQNMRNFRDILIGKGYDFSWLELPEGHSWGLWRATTDLMLKKFIPGTTTHLIDEIIKSMNFELEAYPNPFNPEVNVTFSLPESTEYNMDIFTTTGEQVFKSETLISNGKNRFSWRGAHYSGDPLPSGVYLLRVKSGIRQKTIKLMLLR